MKLLIYQYHDSQETWERFIYKASIGSYKAPMFLTQADFAYMSFLTKVAEAPNSMECDDYESLFESHFKKIEKPKSVEDLFIKCLDLIPIRYIGKSYSSDDHYKNIWERKDLKPTISEHELTHDSIVYLFKNWNSKHILASLETKDDTSYNSLEIVSAMIFLLLTWPNKDLIKTNPEFKEVFF